MKRVVIGAVGLVVVAAAGWSAFWFANRSTVEEKMREALATLERAGVPNSFDSITVSGFPFAYKGLVNNLKAGGVAMPSVSASIAIDSPNTVVFELPPTFEVVTPADPAAPDGDTRTFNVTSQALRAEVTLVQDGAYDLAAFADRVTLVEEGDTTEATVKDFQSLGVLKIDGSGEAATLKLATQAANVTIEGEAPPEDGAAPTPFIVTIVEGGWDIDGSLDALSGGVEAGSIVVDDGTGGVFELQGLAYKTAVVAKDRFDPTPIAEATNFEAALSGFFSMATSAIAEGGAFTTAFKMAALKGSGEVSEQTNSAASGPIAIDVEVAPSRIGLDLAFDNLDFNLNVPDQTGVLAFKAQDLAANFEATPAEAFDLSAIAEMSGSDAARDAASEQFAAAFGDQILKGGSVTFSTSSGPAETNAPMQPPMGGFDRISSVSGPSKSMISLTPDAGLINSELGKTSYVVSGGGAELGGVLDGFLIDVKAPLRAAEEEQTASVLIEMDKVALDDGVWAMVDPDETLTREINGARIGADAILTIRRDLLSPDAEIGNLSNPAALPGPITFADTYLDALGLRAELSGEVQPLPLPTGALVLDVRDWAAFLEGVRGSALGRDPQTDSTLSLLDNYVTTYGVPGDAPNLTRFEIDVSPLGVVINGRPFEG